jgi:hypothetical protein
VQFAGDPRGSERFTGVSRTTPTPRFRTRGSPAHSRNTWIGKKGPALRTRGSTERLFAGPERRTRTGRTIPRACDSGGLRVPKGRHSRGVIEARGLYVGGNEGSAATVREANGPGPRLPHIRGREPEHGRLGSKESPRELADFLTVPWGRQRCSLRDRSARKPLPRHDEGSGHHSSGPGSRARIVSRLILTGRQKMCNGHADLRLAFCSVRIG